MILKWSLLAMILCSCVHPQVSAKQSLRTPRSLLLRPWLGKSPSTKYRDRSYQDTEYRRTIPDLTLSPLDPRAAPHPNWSSFTPTWSEIEKEVERTGGFQRPLLSTGSLAPGTLLSGDVRLRAEQAGQPNRGDSFLDNANSGYGRNDDVGAYTLSIEDLIAGRP